MGLRVRNGRHMYAFPRDTSSVLSFARFSALFYFLGRAAPALRGASPAPAGLAYSARFLRSSPPGGSKNKVGASDVH